LYVKVTEVPHDDGITAADGDEAEELPAALVATTVKV
jgi:hypothetical protein